MSDEQMTEIATVVVELAVAKAEIERLTAELAEGLSIREALVKWDFGGDGNRSRTESAMQQRDTVEDRKRKER